MIGNIRQVGIGGVDGWGGGLRPILGWWGHVTFASSGGTPQARTSPWRHEDKCIENTMIGNIRQVGIGGVDGWGGGLRPILGWWGHVTFASSGGTPQARTSPW